MKIELDKEELEMREQGYNFKLYIETEVMGGETFRHTYYFKTIEECEKKINETNEWCIMWDEYWINSAEITNLENNEVIRRI